MRKNQKNQRKQNNNSSAMLKQLNIAEHPPQIPIYQLNWSGTLRFTTTALQNNFVVTYPMLLNTIVVALTATTSATVFELVKIRKVSMWTTSSGLGSPISISLQFSNDTNTDTGDFAFHQDTSIGVKPAYVSGKPSASVQKYWRDNSSGDAFTIYCPLGTIIDVELQFREKVGSVLGGLSALVGATPGVTYYRGLDGVAIASSSIIPAGGLPTQ